MLVFHTAERKIFFDTPPELFFDTLFGVGDILAIENDGKEFYEVGLSASNPSEGSFGSVLLYPGRKIDLAERLFLEASPHHSAEERFHYPYQTYTFKIRLLSPDKLPEKPKAKKAAAKV